ncbi:MFS transporter [Rhodococcus hoagii]|nr:MFS transporter [Prescottella equi]NKZ87739.1 MFS transporter [Prescottella equi]
MWAPILLVAMRVVQGIGLGGGCRGDVDVDGTRPAGKKNLYAGFPQMGTPAGLVLANGIFLTISSVMSDSAFASWGWRIPFVLSFVLVAIGLVIRLRVTESPSFTGIVENNAVSKFPLRESLKVGFPRLSLTLLAVLANSAVAYAFMVFSLSYGSHTSATTSSS